MPDITPSYSTFLADPLREDNETLELYPRSTVEPYRETPLYFSLQEFGTLNTEIPSGQLFARRIINSFQYTQGDPSADGGGAKFMSGFIPNTRGAVVSLRISHGDMDLGTEPPELGGVPLRSFAFGGRRAVYRHGGKCSTGEMAFGDYHVLLDGVCKGQPKIDGDRAVFTLQGKDARLDHPLNTRVLYGTQYCVVFDKGDIGAAHYVSCGIESAHNITTLSAKYEFLIWLEAYPASGGTIMSKGVLGTNGVHIRISDQGKIRFSTSQTGASQTTISTPVPLRQWVRVSCLMPSSSVTIFLDGEDSTETRDVHIASATAASNTLYIGRSNANTEHFRWAVDDFRIDTTGLDEETIDEQAFRELDSIEAADTVLYAKFNEKVGTSALDYSPTGATISLTGAEFAPSGMGNSDSAGRLIPMVFGQKRGIVPLPIDLDIQLHALHPGPINAILAARIGLNPDAFDDSEIQDFGDFLTFITHVPVEGSYSVYSGDYWTLVYYGDRPNHIVTFDFQGDKTGGVYRATPVATVRHMITSYGPDPLVDPDEINDAQWDALEASNDPAIGLYVNDAKTIQTVVGPLLASIGAAMWNEDTDGLTHIKIVDLPGFETEVLEITERDVEMGSLQIREGGTPFWKVNVFFDECHFEFSTDDVLEEMRGTEIEEFHKRPWRLQYKSRNFVKRLWPDSSPYDVKTALLDPDDALIEAGRLSQMLRRPDQGIVFFMPFPSVPLRLYDVVKFHYQDEDINGEKQSRHGTTSSSKFYIVAKKIIPRRGGYIIALWRPIAS